MTRYTVREDVTVEHGHGLWGTITAQFVAGDITPTNEQEEWILQHLLVPAGVAEVASTTTRKGKGD